MIGLCLAALALYAAYAAEFEDVLRRPLLPLGRRGKASVAVEAPYAEQIATSPTSRACANSSSSCAKTSSAPTNHGPAYRQSRGGPASDATRRHVQREQLGRTSDSSRGAIAREL